MKSKRAESHRTITATSARIARSLFPARRHKSKAAIAAIRKARLLTALTGSAQKEGLTRSQ
jgi:hypothetical protein